MTRPFDFKESKDKHQRSPLSSNKTKSKQEKASTKSELSSVTESGFTYAAEKRFKMFK